MDGSPETPGGPPPEGPAVAPPPRRAIAQFLLGVVLGFLAIGLAGILAALLVMSLSGPEWGARAWIVCVVEAAGFVVVLLAALRTRRRGLAQGVLTGGALVLLICAACWAYVGISQ